MRRHTLEDLGRLAVAVRHAADAVPRLADCTDWGEGDTTTGDAGVSACFASGADPGAWCEACRAREAARRDLRRAKNTLSAAVGRYLRRNP